MLEQNSSMMQRTFMDFPTDELGDGTYTKTRIDALKKVLREKDKENIAYMN